MCFGYDGDGHKQLELHEWYFSSIFSDISNFDVNL